MKIKRIKEGRKIKAPGAYRIPMVWYHSNCCAGPSISSSGLRKIENESPAHYWAFSYLNPHAFPEPDKQALGFGRAAHCLLLGGESFKKHYAVRPSKWKDWRTNDAKEWRDKQIEAGRTVITEADLTTIKLMSAVLKRHPILEAANLLSGQIEASLIWQDRETGVWLKARPDVIPEFDGVASDYKSATAAQPNDCRKAIWKFGYHMQLALIAEGYEAIFGRPLENFLLVFQEYRPPFNVMPVEIDADAIYWGRCQNRRAIRTFADCLDKGEWPGYADEIAVSSLPEWYTNRLAEEQTNGLLPNVGGVHATPA